VFSPPSAETHYAYPEEEDDFEYPIEKPEGGLFKTLARSLSLKRVPTATTLPEADQEEEEEVVVKKKHSFFGKFFSRMMFGNKKIPETMKKNKDVPLTKSSAKSVARSKSLRMSQATVIATTPKASMAFSPPDETFFTTLSRTFSMKKKYRDEEFNTTTQEQVETIQFFEPLDIPWDETFLTGLKKYRITQHQIEALERIISIFNGTHNWHNYIPGASQNDPRCYLRILNIELAKPQMHHEMEWIRIKVQAKAFARLQIRKMISFAIMVVRTNTPTSVIGNSFGIHRIHLPEIPGIGLILDESVYHEYNMYSDGIHREPIEFDTIKVRICINFYDNRMRLKNSEKTKFTQKFMNMKLKKCSLPNGCGTWIHFHSCIRIS
jgi:tRNA pseudouridine(38-40) synthase